MKSLLLGLTIAALAVGGGAKGLAPSGVATTVDYSNLPNPGENDEASYVTSKWNPNNTGSKRISERSVMVNQVNNWGERGVLANRTYDISSFEFSVDVTNITSKVAMIITFGSTDGSYPTDAFHQLNFDIVSDNVDTNKFLVTCSNDKTAHNRSIPGFTDGGQWMDDANFVGVETKSINNSITIAVSKTSETMSNITVNDVSYTVSNSDLYKNFVDSYDSYVSIGTINRPGVNLAYQINYVGDASDKVYFSSTGAFGKVKEGITSINENKATLFETLDGVLQAKKQFDALPYQELYSHDRAYFASDYNALQNELNTKIAEMGDQVYLQLFENDVLALEEKCQTLTTEEEILAAIDLKAKADNSKSSINEATLTDDLKARYDELVAKMDASYAAIKEASPVIYNAKLTAYDTAIKAIASIDDVNAAFALKTSMPNVLLQYMSQEDSDACSALLEQYNTALNDKLKMNSSLYTQGAEAYSFVNDKEELGMMFTGNSMGVNKEESSGVYLEEALTADNFSMRMNISDLPKTSGSWFSFGLMEKPEMFVFADNQDTQNNKGIFFLLTRKNSTTIAIQAYMISLTSNRFYDGALTQQIEIPSDGDINFSIKKVTKTIAGMEGTYIELRFNDVTFDQEVIKDTKLKTVYGKEMKGYLMFASNGCSQNNAAVVTVKSINNVSPMASSHSVEEDVTPTSSDKTKSYQLGTTSDVKFALDTKGQDLTSVQVNGTELEKTSYEFSNNTLTLKNAYLNTLKEGDVTVTASTSKGTVTWTLTLIKANESEKPTKKGCKGSVAATSILISAFALCGVGLALKKKKEEE